MVGRGHADHRQQPMSFPTATITAYWWGMCPMTASANMASASLASAPGGLPVLVSPLIESGTVFRVPESRVLQPALWVGRLDKIMATRKRHSPEQIVRKLMAADRLLAEGKDTVAVRRELGVSEAFVPLNLAGSQTRQVAVLIMVFPQQVRASGSGQSGRAGLVTVTSHPHWVSGQW